MFSLVYITNYKTLFSRNEILFISTRQVKIIIIQNIVIDKKNCYLQNPINYLSLPPLSLSNYRRQVLACLHSLWCVRILPGIWDPSVTRFQTALFFKYKGATKHEYH